MDQLKWDEVMPEVSERFHSRVENSLAFIEKKDERKQTMKVKHKLVFAAAAVLVFGSITASAAGLLRWNSNVAESFEADEAAQEKLIEQGAVEVYEKTDVEIEADEAVADMESQSGQIYAEDNGVKVSLLQTIQDERYLYVAVQVDTPDDIALDGGFVFEELDTGVGEGFMSMTAGWLDDGSDIYEFWLGKEPGVDMNGKVMNIFLKNLQGDEGKQDFYTAVEGTWELSWELNFQDTTQIYELNETISIGGYDIVLEKIEISPISSILYYSGEDLQEFQEEYAMERENIPYDAYVLLDLMQVGYEDGSVTSEFTGGGSGGPDEESGLYISSQAFGKIVDVEGLTSIFIGPYDEMIEISLK